MAGLQTFWLSSIKQRLQSSQTTLPQMQVKGIPQFGQAKFRDALYPKIDPNIGKDAWHGTINRQISQSINAGKMVPLPRRRTKACRDTERREASSYDRSCQTDGYRSSPEQTVLAACRNVHVFRDPNGVIVGIALACRQHAGAWGTPSIGLQPGRRRVLHVTSAICRMPLWQFGKLVSRAKPRTSPGRRDRSRSGRTDGGRGAAEGRCRRHPL
jgi:hypothetical protein